MSCQPAQEHPFPGALLSASHSVAQSSEIHRSLQTKVKSSRAKPPVVQSSNGITINSGYALQRSMRQMGTTTSPKTNV